MFDADDVIFYVDSSSIQLVHSIFITMVFLASWKGPTFFSHWNVEGMFQTYAHNYACVHCTCRFPHYQFLRTFIFITELPRAKLFVACQISLGPLSHLHNMVLKTDAEIT